MNRANNEEQTREDIKVLMISHLYPGNPSSINPNSGIFIKEQLKEYTKLVDIFLYVPIDVIPGLRITLEQTGFINKLKVIMTHFYRTLFKKPTGFNKPVSGKFIRYFSLPFKSATPFWSGFSLFVVLFIRVLLLRRQFNFNAIHGQTVIPDGLAAILLGKIFKAPVIVTVRGSDIHSIKENYFNKKVVKYVLTKADIVTCVSQDLKRRIIAFGISANKINVITNGISSNFVNEDYNNVRKHLEIPDDVPVILTVCKMIELKDPFTLIKAYQILRKKYSTSHLILVGGGPLEADIKHYIMNNNLKNQVHFEGFVPHTKVADYMKACNIFCLPSTREGWPNVIFEAMIFGKPVVASNVGGIPEAICDEDYGFLVKSQNEEHLAKALSNALDKDWDHQKIKNYALNNTWEKVAKKYYSLYQKIVN